MILFIGTSYWYVAVIDDLRAVATGNAQRRLLLLLLLLLLETA